MSQELWQNIPQDLFMRIFIEDIQSFYTSGQPSVRGFRLWYNLMKICKKWRYLMIEVARTYPNFHLNISSWIYLSDNSITMLTGIKILDLSYTNLVDNQLKLLNNVTRINLSGNNKITNKGLSYLRNVEYLNISNTYATQLDKCLLEKLTKLKILEIDAGTYNPDIIKNLAITNPKLQIVFKHQIG